MWLVFAGGYHFHYFRNNEIFSRADATSQATAVRRVVTHVGRAPPPTRSNSIEYIHQAFIVLWEHVIVYMMKSSCGIRFSHATKLLLTDARFFAPWILVLNIIAFSASSLYLSRILTTCILHLKEHHTVWTSSGKITLFLAWYFWFKFDLQNRSTFWLYLLVEPLILRITHVNFSLLSSSCL